MTIPIFDNTTVLIELAFATFRLALLCAKEKGPNDILCRVRDFCKQCRYLPVDCFWCWSVWWGTAMAALLFWLGVHTASMIALPFALSGAAVVLNQAFTKD